MHDEPYVQYGAKAIEPPAGARRSGSFRRPRDCHEKAAVRREGCQRFHQGHPGVSHASPRRPRLEFGPHWIDRLVVATGQSSTADKLEWRDGMAHPHGWVLGPREFGEIRRRAENG